MLFAAGGAHRLEGGGLVDHLHADGVGAHDAVAVAAGHIDEGVDPRAGLGVETIHQVLQQQQRQNGGSQLICRHAVAQLKHSSKVTAGQQVYSRRWWRTWMALPLP